MTSYEKDLEAARQEGLDVKEKRLKSDASALICGNRVAININKLSTTKEKSCVLAEERGHYQTTVGNILDLSIEENRKQEYRARLWGYDIKIGLLGLIRAFEHRCCTPHEAAEFLEVTDEYFMEAMNCYREKYGICTSIDNYIICFIPTIRVIKLL